MTNEVSAALESDRTIDITTTGRKSGQPRRLEIWFHNLEGRFFITGLPGRRGWYANLLANPEFTFHLKESVRADLAGTARPVTDPIERRSVFEALLARLERTSAIDRWVADSPLVEVTLAS